MCRACDIVFSFLALLFLLPLFVVVMIVLRCTGEGEVFYRQLRSGRAGKKFDILKFATMLKDSPNMGGGAITRVADPRVLPIGKILRKTKINELPQLVNVLVGEMSLIGPRPQALDHYAMYTVEQRRTIERVRPGLSGVGSIFFRDEESLMSKSDEVNRDIYRDIIMPYKGDLEVWFVQNQSIWLYLNLIILTCCVVLFPRWDIRHGALKDLPEMSADLKSTFKRAP